MILKNRSVISFAAVILLAFSLCACSNTEALESTTSEESSSASETASPNSSKEENGVYVTVPGDDNEYLATITEGTILSESELTDFDITQTADELKETFKDQKSELTAILNELGGSDLEETYWKAYALRSLSERDCSDLGILTRSPGASLTVDCNDEYEWTTSETGLKYKSIYDTFLTSFTEDCAEEIMYSYHFVNCGGELFAGGFSSTTTSYIVHYEYEVVSQTDSEIVIRENRYIDIWQTDELVYDEEKKDDYTLKHVEMAFVKTDDGWRCSEMGL